MSANGRISFEAEGESLYLLFDINAICALEDIFDKGVEEIAKEMAGQMEMRKVRTLFFAGLKDCKPCCTQVDAGRVMSALGVEAAAALVGRAFALGFPQPEAGAAKGNPPQPASKRRAG
jgi:hypothetical protein